MSIEFSKRVLTEQRRKRLLKKFDRIACEYCHREIQIGEVFYRRKKHIVCKECYPLVFKDVDDSEVDDLVWIKKDDTWILEEVDNNG